jgi:hypothetical protein
VCPGALNLDGRLGVEKGRNESVNSCVGQSDIGFPGESARASTMFGIEISGLQGKRRLDGVLASNEMRLYAEVAGNNASWKRPSQGEARKPSWVTVKLSTATLFQRFSTTVCREIVLLRCEIEGHNRRSSLGRFRPTVDVNSPWLVSNFCQLGQRLNPNIQNGQEECDKT